MRKECIWEKRREIDREREGNMEGKEKKMWKGKRKKYGRERERNMEKRNVI